MKALIFVLSLSLLSCAGYVSKDKLRKGLSMCKKTVNGQRYDVDRLKKQLETLQTAQAAVAKKRVIETSKETNRDRWEATYVDVSERMRQVLVDVDHQLSIRRGALVVSLELGAFFSSGDDTLTDNGGHIVHKLATVLKTLDNRQALITCRSVDVPPVEKKAEPVSARELAAKRAIAVAAGLEWRGVDPEFLITGGVDADATYRRSEPAPESAAEEAEETAGDDIDDLLVTDKPEESAEATEEAPVEPEIAALGVIEIEILPREDELPFFPQVL